MLETLVAARRTPPSAGTATQALPHDMALRRLAPMARFSLRVRTTPDAPAEAAGFRLDQPVNRCVAAGDGLSVRLGPDEWLILAPETEAERVQQEIGTSLHNNAHSLVDVSHRNVGFELSGARAADALNAGCPLDLHESMFPAGTATRTLLGKIEIVLIRADAAPRYHVECWRSFAAYAHDFLTEAVAGLGGG